MYTARTAARFLFDLAEGFARSEAAAPMPLNPAMPYYAKGAISALAELHWRCGVQVAPDAARWQGQEWGADPFGDLADDAA